MLEPNYPLYSCRSIAYQIKKIPIWLYGLNNLMVSLLIVQICVDLIFTRD